MAALLFIEQVHQNQQAFEAKVREIAAKLSIDPNWLMAVMKLESGLNSQAINSNGGATGLIQFMPSTAQGLGTTTAALHAMSNVEQLDWVYKYFKPYKSKLIDYPSLYLVTFFPAALGHPDDWVIHSAGLSAQTIANANPVADLDHNGIITVGEFKNYVYNKFSPAIVAILKKKTQ